MRLAKEEIYRNAVWNVVKELIIKQEPFFMTIYNDERWNNIIPKEVLNKYNNLILLNIDGGTLKYAQVDELNSKLHIGTTFNNEIVEFSISKFDICSIAESAHEIIIRKPFLDTKKVNQHSISLKSLGFDVL